MKPLLIGTLAVIGLLSCACSTPPTAAQPVRTITITLRPSVSHSPMPAPTPATSSPVAAACQTPNLTGSVGTPQGLAGGFVVAIVFKNLKTTPCTLRGYPGVTQAAGNPVKSIGQPATANPATPRTLVTVPPGGFASADLKIANAANYLAATCRAVKATWLLVTPPNQRTPLHIAFGSTACQGTAKLMSVTSVVQGSAG